MKRLLAALVLAMSVTACATGTTNLTLTVPEGHRGVISEAPPMRLEVPAVTDARSNQTRIGDKRNGYGMVMGQIGTTQPPTEIVQQALEHVLTANGHSVGGADDRYSLRTTLKTFWFDYRVGLVTVEFFGTINADVSLVDRTTGQAVYTETFEGYYSERNAGGLSTTWTRIMNAALTDFTTKVSNSEGLRAALAGTQPAPANTAS